MRATRAAVALAAALACLGGVAPAGAGHRKPVSTTYDVVLPVPYAVDGPSHCADGVDSLSRDKREVVIPDRGRLDVQLSGFAGDWVLELFDAKGRMLAQAAAWDLGDAAPVRKLTYKKGTRGQRLTLAVCNVTGGPRGSVRWTYSFHGPPPAPREEPCPFVS